MNASALSPEQRQRALKLADGDHSIFSAASSTNPKAHARFSRAEVIIALADCVGRVTLAARRLGCSRSTVKNYIKRDPAVRHALAAIRDETCDLAISPLVQDVMAGNLFASIHYLKLFHSGYGGRARKVRVAHAGVHEVGLTEDDIELVDDL